MQEETDLGGEVVIVPIPDDIRFDLGIPNGGNIKVTCRH